MFHLFYFITTLVTSSFIPFLIPLIPASVYNIGNIGDMNRFIFNLIVLLSSHNLCFGKRFSNAIADEERIIRISPNNENTFAEGQSSIHGDDDWNWRYFPLSPAEAPHKHQDFADRHDMYNVKPTCDDTRTNLTLDFDGSAGHYKCSESRFPVDSSVRPILHEDTIPPGYSAPHYCMHLKIEYPDPLITFGGHRPHWGRYGEYSFLPRQRWMHNNEHGAVIMLYHPCANPTQVDRLRTIVTSCLFRHIITPYNLLPKDRPLALIAWGWYLNMNTVNTRLVQQFITEHARRAPEDVEKEGQYDNDLKVPAQIISDRKDSKLCPNFSMT